MQNWSSVQAKVIIVVGVILRIFPRLDILVSKNEHTSKPIIYAWINEGSPGSDVMCGCWKWKAVWKMWEAWCRKMDKSELSTQMKLFNMWMWVSMSQTMVDSFLLAIRDIWKDASSCHIIVLIYLSDSPYIVYRSRFSSRTGRNARCGENKRCLIKQECTITSSGDADKNVDSKSFDFKIPLPIARSPSNIIVCVCFLSQSLHDHAIFSFFPASFVKKHSPEYFFTGNTIE